MTSKDHLSVFKNFAGLRIINSFDNYAGALVVEFMEPYKQFLKIDMYLGLSPLITNKEGPLKSRISR